MTFTLHPNFIPLIRRTLVICGSMLACVFGQMSFAAVNVNQIVNDSAPSIVQVQGIQWVKVKIPEQYQNITDDPVYQSLSGIFIDQPHTQKSAPVVKKRLSGSGFIISSNGQIATNAQWLKGANEVLVILANKRSYKARMLRIDSKRDLALLKITATNLPALALARQVEEGEGVIAVGHNRAGISVGVVVSTPAQTPNSGLVSDADISRANSGGPLLNIYGQVLGICSTQMKTALGLYRHPTLDKLVSDKVADKHTATFNALTSVGFSAADMNQAQNAALGQNTATGALVIQVRPASIAANAGLQKNDIIIALESSNIVNADDLNVLPDFLRQDNQARLVVFREGEQIELTLISPKLTSKTSPWAWRRLGLRTRLLSQAQKDAADVSSGLVITDARNAATEAGLQAGDWLISINNQALTSVTQLNQIAQNLRAGDVIVLYAIHGGVRQFITLTATDDE